MTRHSEIHPAVSRTVGLIAVAFLLIGALLGGCSDDDDSPNGAADMTTGSDAGSTMGDDNMTSDPDTVLATLAFTDAADDARHRCLLDTFAEDAQVAGLTENPALSDRGTVSKTWCSASGEDANNCLRGYVTALASRGTRAVSVFADMGADGTVQDYGFIGARNPAAGSDWSLVLERRFGAGGSFSARFIPYVGEVKDFMQVVPIREFPVFRSSDIEATLTSDASPDARLQALSESPVAFAQLLGSELDALLSAWETRLQNGDVAIDVTARTEALATARAEITRRRAVVTDSAAALHALLSEQVALDRCR